MLSKDEWLSRYFKGGAYSYQLSDQDDLKKIREGFVYVKLPFQNKIECNYLIKNGFNLVEISLFFEQKSPVPLHSTSKLNIDFVKPEEENQVIEIAKNTFSFSRFHQDDRIPKSLANQIKADWVANYFLGKRGEQMIIARVNGVVAGFLSIINKTTIDLIAVSSDFQRMGIASAMIGFANNKIGLLQAGTQLNNQNSILMYQKSGFLLKQSAYVLHHFLENKVYETV